VTESTPISEEVVSDNPRMKRLLDAERACLDAGGCVLRLAGLYNLNRGAHNYWLTSGKGEFPSSPDGVVNLLHYDDAAGACLAALSVPDPDELRGRVFLVSDGHPTTRAGICRSAVQAGAYREYRDRLPKFIGGSDKEGLGKIYDGSETNRILKWSPRYQSFDEFMKANV